MKRSPPKSHSREVLSNTINTTSQMSTQDLRKLEKKPSASLTKGKSVSAEQIQSRSTPATEDDEQRQVSTLPRDYSIRERPTPAPRTPRSQMMGTASSMETTGHSKTFNSTG